MPMDMVLGWFLIAAAVICGVCLAVAVRKIVLSYNNVVLLDAAVILLIAGVSCLTHQYRPLHALWRLFAFMVVPLLAACVGVLLVYDSVIMLKKEGLGRSTLLTLAAGVFMLGGMTLTVLAYKRVFIPSPFMRSVMTMVVIASFFVALTFSTIMLYGVCSTGEPKKVEADYIVVHGCAIFGDRITPLLRGRVDKAVELMERAGTSTKLVVSGGMGPGETISEAQAMWNYLEGKGFDMERVILEDTSKTTKENLRNVRDMFEADGVKKRYLCVTSEYHAFRTGIYARRLGMNARTCGSRTARYYRPSASIREYIALMVDAKWLNLAVLALWAYFTVQDISSLGLEEQL